MTFKDLEKYEDILLDNNYIKTESLNGGNEFCWSKFFENFTIKYCFEQVDKKSTIKLKRICKFDNGVKVIIKDSLSTITLKRFEEMCNELSLVILW